MAIPVNNPSKVTRKRTKLKKKKNNNLGSAPAKLEDEGGQGRASSDFKTQGMISKARNSTKASSRSLKKKPVNPKMAASAKRRKANPELYEKPESIKQSTSLKAIPNTTYDILGPGAGSKKVQPTKQTQLQNQKRLADRIRAGGSDRARKRKDQGMMGPSAGDTPKPLAPKVAPTPRPKPAVSAPAAPAAPAASKIAPKVAPRPRPKPSRLTGGGMDAELLSTPTGVTSGRVKKTAAKPAAKPAAKDDGYKFYGKEGTGLGDFSRKHGMQYATQKQFEKDFNMDDGEKAGGRPGRGKLKTQGMNKAGKRKAGFSGRGSGAALRGF